MWHVSRVGCVEQAPLEISFPVMVSNNLRSKKGLQATQKASENNLKQIQLLITSLADKIDKLDADSRERCDTTYGQLQKLEKRTNNFV